MICTICEQIAAVKCKNEWGREFPTSTLHMLCNNYTRSSRIILLRGALISCIFEKVATVIRLVVVMSESTLELNDNNNNNNGKVIELKDEDSGENELKMLLMQKINSFDLAKEVDENRNSDISRYRSMSDGSAVSEFQSEEPFEVCPSLPDSVLEKMGLQGDELRERFSEDDLEQKFTRLALAFKVDSATIKDRCERQRRNRDQTESNLQSEIERLIEKVNRIQPLCVDFETTELLGALLTQVDLVMRASSLAAISAARYGAVQLEERLNESVRLMITHVDLLKQQRDFARKHLQYTKRVLQHTSITNQQRPPITKELQMGKRRASIATISTNNLQLHQPHHDQHESKKAVSRRSSTTSLVKTARPSRLELGLDLVNIKEGIVENEGTKEEEENIISEEDETNSSQQETEPLCLKSNFNLRLHRRVALVRRTAKEKFKLWSQDGTLHEIYCFCALLCFSISLLIMVNIVIEYEFSKRGINDTSYFFWHWTTDTGDSPVVRNYNRIHR